MAKLVIVGDDGSRREVELGTRNLRIGRAPENDLALSDPTKGVSRTHAELRYENGHYIVIDLNSQNGTWINGNRVQRADVAAGSEIAIGGYRLTLQGVATKPTVAETPVGNVAAPVPAVQITEPLAAPSRAAAPAAAAPPPLRRAPKKAPARSASPAAPGPIAALARLPKPVLFGGCFAIAFVIIVLGLIFAPSEPAPSSGDTTDAAAATPSTPATETNAQIIDLHHLAEGQALDPNRAEATDLKMKAQESLAQQKQEAALASAAAASTAASPDGAASTVPAPPGAQASAPGDPPKPAPTPAPSPAANAAAVGAANTTPPRAAQPPRSSAAAASGEARGGQNLPSPRRPGETTQAWRARNSDLQSQYSAAKDALDRRQFSTAAAGFDAILKVEPGYLDAPQLLVRAREELKAGGREALEAGDKLDDAGSWVQALEQYDRARQLDPSLAASAEDASKRVREKMRLAGAESFKRARQYDALGRSADALKEYENAAQWLPSDDPNRATARQRADALKAGVK